MSFESQSETGTIRSPGGFEFGIQGFSYGDPIPKSITFFLDNTAMVCDQHGRCIRRAVSAEGSEVRFADSPPDANREGDVTPRPQYATHAQVIAALAAERIDWLAYDVRWRAKDGAVRVRGNVPLEQAETISKKLAADGMTQVSVVRTIACAGWPQLPYDQLQKLPEAPPTPKEELLKIKDHSLRRDALRLRREVDDVRQKELANLAEE